MDTSSGSAKRNVLIVGGASGIGRAACSQLLAPNVRLVVADKDQTTLAVLSDGWPGQIETLPLDITDLESVAGALEWVAREIGKLDVVVMSAAVHSAFPAEFMPDETIEKVIQVNLIAHIKFVRDILPHLNEGGRIIGISSNCADIGIPMESVYAASKAGLERFYEALSIEVAYRKILPVLIQPGNVNTGFNETGNDYVPRGNAFVDQAYQKVVAAIDSRNGIDPQVVAQTIVTAINAPKPRIRYIVGLNALKAHWAKRLLGTGMALKLLSKYFGL